MALCSLSFDAGNIFLGKGTALNVQQKPLCEQLQFRVRTELQGRSRLPERNE